MKKKNIMIGPSLLGEGGISSVLKQYSSGGFFEQLNAVFWTSWQPGAIPSKILNTTSTCCKLLRWVATGRVGLIHLHSASNISFLRKSLFATIGIAFGIPVVFHIHAGRFFHDYRSFSKLYKSWVRFILNRSSAVVVLSQVWANEASALVKYKDKIRIIPNPVDRSLPPSTPKVSRQPNELRLLFLGGLTEAKGFFDLIDAVANLRIKGLDIKLRCGGKGDSERISSLLARRGLTDSIVLLGWIDSAQKTSEFGTADAFVLPSYFEGQPMSILEAMQAGVPVISTAVGGIPDIIRHEHNGLLVAPGDVNDLEQQIERLAKAPSLGEELSRHAHLAVAESHSPSAVLDSLRRTYDTILPAERICN